jgi:hypothetical protein
MKYIPCLVLLLMSIGAGCNRSSPSSAGSSIPQAAPTANPSGAAVSTQVVAANPCAWLAPEEVEKLLGGVLARAPQPVISAENPRPAAMGEACLYALPETSGRQNTVAVQLLPDESGAMQTTFGAMDKVEAEFNGAQPTTGAGAASHWDYVNILPGGLIALRQGRIAAQVLATGSLAQKGSVLATAMLEHMADLPFVLAAEDAAVPAAGPDPCRFVTRAEAETVLGPLIVAPYRSRKATALAYGSGGSCAYYSAHHRALVLTPKESHGAQLFAMLGGADVKVARLLHTAGSVDVATGDWDQMSMGVDGTLHALKGDKALSVQFVTSPADQNAAATLLALAFPRL